MVIPKHRLSIRGLFFFLAFNYLFTGFFICLATKEFRLKLRRYL